MSRTRKNKGLETSLDGFHESPADHGLSLDELSESFARLLGAGELPYDGGESPRDSGDVPGGEAQTLLTEDPWPVSPERILEAILFVGHPDGEPVSGRQVAALMRGVRAAEVEQFVGQLNESYAKDQCPYHIESLTKGFCLVLRPEFYFIRDRFYGRVPTASLSAPAVTALAVVAYHQPMTKSQVQEMSDPQAARALTQLVRRGLLSVDRQKIGARTESAYTTTRRFLELFGLTSLDELPRSQDLDDTISGSR